MKDNKLTTGSNMRWESSRMMLPEHVQALRALADEEIKINKPHLDEQKWEEIERIVHDAVCTKIKIDVSYYKDGGIQLLANSYVLLDHSRGHLLLNDNRSGITQTISISDLIDVQYSGAADRTDG